MLKSDDYFNDWKSDNIKSLIDDFLEENEESFDKFCIREFTDYCEEKFG